MGLFGSIFGRKTKEYSANDAKILGALVALRISRGFEAQGYSTNEAQALTEEMIKKRRFCLVEVCMVIKFGRFQTELC